jgi:hypothetical protein
MSEIKRWLCIGAWCGLWFGLAAWARYGLVEQGEVAARCDQGGLDAACRLRAAVIQAFILDRLGWASVGLAAAAAFAAWAQFRVHLALAFLAMAAACSGLWLYSAQWAAPALLLAGVSLVREGRAVPPSASNTAP